jgi:hypothetical protein
MCRTQVRICAERSAIIIPTAPAQNLLELE